MFGTSMLSPTAIVICAKCVFYVFSMTTREIEIGNGAHKLLLAVVAIGSLKNHNRILRLRARCVHDTFGMQGVNFFRFFKKFNFLKI